MKKVLFTLCLAIALVMVTTAAYAQSSRLYVAGYMGLNLTTETEFDENTTPRSGDFTYDNSMSFAGALGLRLTQNWRLEGELSYRKASIDTVDITTGGTFRGAGEIGTWLALANLYYDFDMEWKNLSPYVTGGVGFAMHSGDIGGVGGMPSSTGNSFGLAWQAGAGLKYRVDDSLAITGGYRYLGTSSLEVDSYDIDYGAHELRLGLEYDLPVMW
ncbi:MAG: porin family protein [Rhodospirillales bacterium]|nr:porin family protein [Rhodospirillales bacterium]